MKSLARKISQQFIKDSNGSVRSASDRNLNHTNALKKKKSIKDMMVDTFKNPFDYLKNSTMDSNVLPKNNNISGVTYSTFTRSEYESVFNKPIEKSDPSRLIYVPKSLMQEENIDDLQSPVIEATSSDNNITEVSDSNTVNSRCFNEIPVQTVSSLNKANPSEEEEEEGHNSESTLYSDSESNNKSNENNSQRKELNYSFFPWRFLKSKLSFSKSDVDTFCNNNKLTSYDRYEDYCSSSETADISEDETAIELQVFHTNTNKINEKDLVPEPEINIDKQLSI